MALQITVCSFRKRLYPKVAATVARISATHTRGLVIGIAGILIAGMGFVFVALEEKVAGGIIFYVGFGIGMGGFVIQAADSLRKTFGKNK